MSRLASSRGRPKPKAGPSKKAPAAAAAGSHSVLWQRPFVNVFKSVRVGDWKRASRKGDASFSMNNGVRSYVVRVRGEVSASNLVTDESGQVIEADGLQLHLSSSNLTGYKGVEKLPKGGFRAQVYSNGDFSTLRKPSETVKMISQGPSVSNTAAPINPWWPCPIIIFKI